MHPFGLDLSDTLIRLALLEHRHSGWRLAVRAEIPVRPGLIVDGEIRNPEEVGRLLTELVKAAGPHTKQAVVSLPERHTFLKLVTVKDEAGRLDDRVKTSASQHLPFTWDELYYDWSPLPQKNSLGQTQVMVAAAPRTLIDTYLQVLAAVGIEPACLEIESLSIARATLTKDQLRGTYIILDLGKTRSTLMLAQKGVVKFSTTIRFSGQALTATIADRLQISPDQAEKAKKLFGLDPQRGQGLLRQILAPQIEALADKVVEAEDFYREHGEDQQVIDGVLLTGSGAMLLDIDQELTARLKHQVTYQPAWLMSEIKHFDPSLAIDIGYTYANAIGLALQSF